MLSCSPIDLVDLSLREYCWMRHEGALLSLVAEIGNQKVLDRTSTELMNIGKFENYRCFDRTSRDSLTFCWSSLPSLGLRIPNILEVLLIGHLLLVSMPLAERVVALVIRSSSLMTQLAFIPAATHLV